MSHSGAWGAEAGSVSAYDLKKSPAVQNKIWSAPATECPQAQGPFWFLGRDRGRIYGKRLPAHCFHIHARRASRTARLSDPRRHECGQVLTTGSYHRAREK